MNQELIKKEVGDCVLHANQMQVANNAQHKNAVEFLKSVKALHKKAWDWATPLVKKTHEAWKEATAKRKELTDPLAEAEGILKNKISDYLIVEEKKRIEEQKKIDEEARKKEAEFKARKEEQAKKWEEKGNYEKAEERRQEAEEHFEPTPVIQSNVEKQDGVSIVTYWRYEIIRADDVPREFCSPDPKKLKTYIDYMKDKSSIPGVKVFKELNQRVRV